MSQSRLHARPNDVSFRFSLFLSTIEAAVIHPFIILVAILSSYGIWTNSLGLISDCKLFSINMTLSYLF
jgi:hypothetical protein